PASKLYGLPCFYVNFLYRLLDNHGGCLLLMLEYPVIPFSPCEVDCSSRYHSINLIFGSSPLCILSSPL
ncbi:hypothetical protein HAX54_040867, partial [Datura stramonium]|nr:hypothetical protein [Datura stramonium]